MTRINLVSPAELYDQHLFAEFREIKMVPKSLARSLVASGKRGETLYQFWSRIPKEYTLNKGHVSFFYDKGIYLQNRYSDLCRELTKRKIAYNNNALLDPNRVFQSLDHNFNNDYRPKAEALTLIRQRLADRVAMKPDWYRMTK